MPTYNAVVNRATPGGQPLIPEVVQREIVQAAVEQSAASKLMRHATMSTNQTRIPVLASFPLVFWVNGASLSDRDTGLKQTTTMTWDNVYINAEELAVIVPIPKNLLADVKYPLWDEIKPRIREAIALGIDETIFFGTLQGASAPTTFPQAIIPAAVAAGNQVVAGTSAIDVLDDINEVMKTVEADGYENTGFWGRTQLRGALRGLRSTTREQLFVPDTGTPSDAIRLATLYGEPIYFSKAGFSGFATGAANYSMITGQWDQAILAVREDLQMEMFREGVITDDAGNIVYNLMQQDMVAMRVTWRGGWAVPNPINRMQGTAANRYPFGVLKQRAAGTGE